MRLIDADKLLFDVSNAFLELLVGKREILKEGDLLKMIYNAPTIDPVKHGRWLRTDAYPHRIYCSSCFMTFIRNDEFLCLDDIPHNYCPNCGARMDEVSE